MTREKKFSGAALRTEDLGVQHRQQQRRRLNAENRDVETRSSDRSSEKTDLATRIPGASTKHKPAKSCCGTEPKDVSTRGKRPARGILL
jgi:hypothetical protein